MGNMKQETVPLIMISLFNLATFIKSVLIFLLGKTDIKNPIETIAAHHDGDEWTEEELEEIERFKEFVKMKRKQKGNKSSS